MIKQCEIRLCGLGGQGIIMMATIIGKAASIFEDRFATLVQSFGPEARGSDCSAQVIVSDKQIAFPYIRNSNIFVALSQSSYNKFVHEMTEDSILVYESELVVPDDRLPRSAKKYGIPGTNIAIEELGKRIVFNIVMLGFFSAVTKLIDVDAMRKSITDSVPSGSEELNLKAFSKGYEFGLDLLK